MKGLILAAGQGSRLQPISSTRPKHAVRVGDRPIIQHAVRALRTAGVQDVGVVVSPANHDAVRTAVGREDVTFVVQERALGTGHAVRAARAFLAQQDTVVYLGDNLFGSPVTPLVEVLRNDASVEAAVAVKEVPNPQAYGVAILDGDTVLDVVEKPLQSTSRHAVTGLFALRAHLLDALDGLTLSERGEYELTQLLRDRARSGGHVRAVHVSGWWSDAGTPADLLTANARVLASLTSRLHGRVDGGSVTGRVVIEAGAVVRDSHVVGPCFIDAGAVVTNSCVGPNVTIGREVRVTDATLRDALVDDHSVIRRPTRPLVGVVLGQHVTVAGEEAPAESARSPALVVGDRSVVTW